MSRNGFDWAISFLSLATCGMNSVSKAHFSHNSSLSRHGLLDKWGEREIYGTEMLKYCGK